MYVINDSRNERRHHQVAGPGAARRWRCRHLSVCFDASACWEIARRTMSSLALRMCSSIRSWAAFSSRRAIELDQLAMLFDGTRGPADQPDRPGHQHLALKVHLAHEGRQVGIACGFDDGGVQVAVVNAVRIHVTVAQRRFADRLMFTQPVELLVRDSCAGEADAEAFERRPHFVEVPHLLLGEFPDEPALVRQLHDEPVGLESMERFTYRCRADVELLGDGVGTKLHARFNPAAHDATPQRAVRARAQLQAQSEGLERQFLRRARRLTT